MIKKLSSKGQIVLPAEYRKSLGLKVGQAIAISREGDRLILEPVSKPVPRFVRLSGYPRPILSAGKGKVVRDRDVRDVFDDDV